MTSSSSLSAFVTGIDPTRYWSLVFDGRVVPLSWDDGERLMALSAAIRAGDEPAQEFRCLRHEAQHKPLMIMVTPETLFELITEYDHTEPPAQSHWFG